MNYYKTEDEEINAIREKIYQSGNEYKIKLLDDERLKNITQKFSNLSEDKIRNIVEGKIEQLKSGKLAEDELQKVECEVAVMITYLPFDNEKNRNYWEGKEKNARKDKQ